MQDPGLDAPLDLSSRAHIVILTYIRAGQVMALILHVWKGNVDSFPQTDSLP